MRYKPTYKPLQMALCAALLGAAFAACSNTEDDLSSVSVGESGVPLSVSAVIQSGDGSRKAGLDAETFEVGDTIGLYILDSSSNAYGESSDSYNVPAVYNGTDFTLTQDVYLTDSVAYVYAYYPYTYTSNAAIGAFIEVSSGDIDVLAAESPATASRDNPEVTLTFSHSLARVTLSVKVSEEIGEALLTSATISSDSQDLSYLVHFFTGLSESETSWTITIACSDTLSSTESTDIDVLLYPTTVEGKTATLVIDDDTYEFDIPTTLTESWAAGCKYTYPVTITKDSATEEDDTTEDTSETINGYDAVDLGLSVRWAAVNIGAESPEDYGNYYAWGEIETKDEYTNMNSVTYSVSDMSDFSGDAEYDAATANWGGSWRMPTYDEMEELVDGCTWEWTTLNDVNGYLVTGDNGNSIFFPATGWIYGSSLRYAGEYGYCWSSTPHASYDSNAYSLYIASDRYLVSNGSRYYGRSVRPVTE